MVLRQLCNSRLFRTQVVVQDSLALREQFLANYIYTPAPERGGWGRFVQASVSDVAKRKKTAFSCLLRFKSGKRDSNSRPQPWQGCALPTELFPHYLLNFTTGISTKLRVQRYSIFRYFQNFLQKKCNYFICAAGCILLTS